MTADPVPLTPDELDTLYRALVQPILFDTATGDHDPPTLVLLGGQPGAGKSRATAGILTDHDGMIALSGDDLRSFHPHYRVLTLGHPERAPALLADATRSWVRRAIDDALDGRHHLLLEGTFGDPDITLDTARRFRDAGYRVRIVAVASPPILSLVSIASRYLRNLSTGNPARFTTLSAHDRGYTGTTRLIDALASDSSADRVTILSRNGAVLFDQPGPDGNATPSAGAPEALDAGRHPQTWGPRATTELLSELRNITTYAIESGHLSPALAHLLLEAHDLALRDVLPNLSIGPDTPQGRFAHNAVTEQHVALRRAADGLQPVPVESGTGPDIVPPTPSGPSVD